MPWPEQTPRYDLPRNWLPLFKRFGINIPDEVEVDPEQEMMHEAEQQFKRKEYRKANPKKTILSDLFSGYTALGETPMDKPTEHTWREKAPAAIGELFSLANPEAWALKGGAAAKTLLAGAPFASYGKNIYHGTQGLWSRFNRKYADENDVLGWLFHGGEGTKVGHPDFEGREYPGSYALGFKKGKGDYRHARVMPLEIEAGNVLDLVDPNMTDMAAAVAALHPHNRQYILKLYRENWKKMKAEQEMTKQHGVELDPMEVAERFGFKGRHFPGGVPLSDVPVRTLSENLRIGPRAFPRTPFDAIRYHDMEHVSWAWPHTTKVRSAISPSVDFTPIESAMDVPLQVTKLPPDAPTTSQLELTDIGRQKYGRVSSAAVVEDIAAKHGVAFGQRPENEPWAPVDFTLDILELLRGKTQQEAFDFIKKAYRDSKGLSLAAKGILFKLEDQIPFILDRLDDVKKVGRRFGNIVADPTLADFGGGYGGSESRYTLFEKLGKEDPELSYIVKGIFDSPAGSAFYGPGRKWEIENAKLIEERKKLLKEHEKNWYTKQSEEEKIDPFFEETYDKKTIPQADRPLSAHYATRAAEIEAEDLRQAGLQAETPMPVGGPGSGYTPSVHPWSEKSKKPDSGIQAQSLLESFKETVGGVKKTTGVALKDLYNNFKNFADQHGLKKLTEIVQSSGDDIAEEAAEKILHEYGYETGGDFGGFDPNILELGKHIEKEDVVGELMDLGEAVDEGYDESGLVSKLVAIFQKHPEETLKFYSAHGGHNMFLDKLAKLTGMKKADILAGKTYNEHMEGWSSGIAQVPEGWKQMEEDVLKGIKDAFEDGKMTLEEIKTDLHAAGILGKYEPILSPDNKLQFKQITPHDLYGTPEDIFYEQLAQAKGITPLAAKGQKYAMAPGFDVKTGEFIPGQYEIKGYDAPFIVNVTAGNITDQNELKAAFESNSIISAPPPLGQADPEQMWKDLQSMEDAELQGQYPNFGDTSKGEIEITSELDKPEQTEIAQDINSMLNAKEGPATVSLNIPDTDMSFEFPANLTYEDVENDLYQLWQKGHLKEKDYVKLVEQASKHFKSE